MDITPSPFLNLDKQTVIGTLKATGSMDPDVLHAKKKAILQAAKFPRMAGVYVMVLGGLLTLTILGAFLGIPLLILGWWMRRRGVRSVKNVEAAFAEFTAAA